MVTGATVAEARDRGLDALAVAAEDADVEVLAEPASSRWGLRHHPARVRVRVRPTGPPPRVGDQRRDRRRSRRRSAGRQRQAQQQGRTGAQSRSRGGRSSRRQSRPPRRGTASKPAGSDS